ncbi:MAG: DUF1624 domain-containing protein [Clostridia bacterium]|nr:DUF1624 domain-containing protein [Clostridia bacterium]
MSTNRKRIYLLDEIRGLAIILMVFYHAFYLLGSFFEMDFMLAAQKFFEPLQPPFACLFILISGISCNLSHSNFIRGIRLLAIALGFTLVTAVVLPKFGIDGAQIIFGILHLLSVSMLLFAVLKKPLSKIPPAVGFAACVLLFFACWTVPSGRILGLALPEVLYANGFTAMLGFAPAGFYSADYFPLIPFVFMFLAGTFAGRFVLGGDLPEGFYKLRCKPLAAIGRKTLIIYIAHWPIIFLLGLIISKI